MFIFQVVCLVVVVGKCVVSDGWTVEGGHYLLGNKFSPVAVLVPHVFNVDGSRCGFCEGLLKVAIEAGAAVAGFCQTANIGVEKVVVNILANPNIRWLVVVGHESMHCSGKAIIGLVRHGVDPVTRRILNCPEAKTGYLPNIPLEAVERFRRQVQVIDLLLPDSEEERLSTAITVTVGTREFHIPADIKLAVRGKAFGVEIPVLTQETLPEVLRFVIHACLQEPENGIVVRIRGRYLEEQYELYDPGAFDDEPYIVQLGRTEQYYEVHVPRIEKDYGLVVADTVADEYHYLLRTVRETGRQVETHYGPTRELLFTHIVILDPEKMLEPMTQTYPLRDLEDIRRYCEALVTGRDVFEAKTAQSAEAYSYGQRIRRWGEEVKKYILTSPDFAKFVSELSAKLNVEENKVREIIEQFVNKFLIVDQIEVIIEHLTRDPSSRQAVICLWNPAADLRYVKSPPCFTILQFFIRDSELHVLAYFRSHDFKNAHIHNISGVRELARHILEELKRRAPEKFTNLKLGKLHFLAGSLHIYETHLYR